MSSTPYKRYSKEFKLEAIRLAGESDKPVTVVARELGLRVNQIYKWKQQLEAKGEGAFPGHGRQAGAKAWTRSTAMAMAAATEPRNPSHARGLDHGSNGVRR